MIKEVQIGEEYDGVVTRVEAYGAFIEFYPVAKPCFMFPR